MTRERRPSSSARPGSRPGSRPGTRRPKPTRGRLAFRVLKWTLLAGLGAAAIGAATLAFLFWHYGADPKLPRIQALKDYHPKVVTRIVSRDGRLIGELFEERRTFVPLEQVAPIMVQAMISAEDEQFRQHEGIDMSGMVRAFLVNLRAGETKQGASTITQQVVKTLLLSPERTFRRKIQEIILARRLESALDKDEILTLYLNQIYFGHGRYGVEEAARFYFGKSAMDLEVGEAATLAGLVQAPERHSPLKHPKSAKQRQTYVLGQLARHGHIEQSVADQWIKEPIRIVKSAPEVVGVAPEVIELVRDELERRHGKDTVPTLGLTVHTTIDVELQEAARASLEKGLRELDERRGYRAPLRFKGKNAEERLAKKKKEIAKAVPGSGPRGGTIYEGLVLSVSDEPRQMVVALGEWRGVVTLGGKEERYNPEGKQPSERFQPDDVVRVRVEPERGRPSDGETRGYLALEGGPQGAIVVIDPKNRHLLALVGGYDFEPGAFNRALRAKRQPGSSFKPFVYAAAIDSGQFTPATVLNDAPEVYELWKPKNYEADNFRGPIRLRVALAHSVNTVAIRLLHTVGPDRVVALAQAMGIHTDLPKELSLALGSGDVLPIELVNAYATFAASGQYAPPVIITKIGDETVVPPAPVEALRPQVAYLASSMMQSVVREGTAAKAASLRGVLAGKTGTTNGNRDAWFVGFAPDIVAGVWLGFDDDKLLGKGEAGSRAALPIWIDFMTQAIAADRGRGSFTPPPGIVVARIDKASGKLAAPGQPADTVMDESFLEGTVPTEQALAPGEVDPSNLLIDQMDEGGRPPAPPAPSPGAEPDPLDAFED